MSHKAKAIFFNIVIWVTIFMLPILFMGLDHTFSWVKLIRSLAMPFVLLIVYYINYSWLVPDHYLKGKRELFWTANIIMTVVLGLAIHGWFEWSGRFIENAPDNELIRNKSFWMHSFQILHGMFYIVVTVGIATSIRMSLKWVESEKAREETMMALREAELENIRYQVNPHFLLNTLNNIYALTAFDQEKAQTAIMELSKLMRHVLYDNQQPSISIKDELQFIDNYINLMKLRMSGEVEIVKRFDVDDSSNVNVAPLIFISLIENAFKHGVSPANKSFIHIHIHASEGLITCLIENSYYPKTESDHSGHGIGLEQVQRRLDLSYPGRYEWEKGIDEKTNTYKSKITLYDTQLHHH
mgnify:CR=1 FL=1